MEQGWYSLLFAHWPMAKSHVRMLVPPELELDTFQNEAWVSITAFHVRMRPRGLFALGKFWSFPELNCRTYVRYRGLPGIYFYSLDAGSLLAVSGARMFYRLPYFRAKMTCLKGRSEVDYRSQRTSLAASFVARYKPVSPRRLAEFGTLEHWLIERYCLFTVAGTKVWRADIHHQPWLLQTATAGISSNTVAAAAGLSLGGPPTLVGYAEQQEVLVWPLRKQ